jgi:anaerobic selenocysteine-containing dehydrogenase
MSEVEVCAYDIPRGNVMAYYPEANILTSQICDPRSKTPAFKNITVQIKTYV